MITSSTNSKIKILRALLAHRREREERKLFVAEGVRLVEEGLRSGWVPRQVFFNDLVSERGQMVVKTAAEKGSEVEQVDRNILESISATETSQGLLAVFELKELPLPERLSFVLILDAIRDPGNLGTILRSAGAAGVQAVLLAPGTTDAYAPKVIRAGMGAHYRLPLKVMDWQQIEHTCRMGAGSRLRILLADASSGIPIWQVDLRGPLALIIGGEAEGAGEAACRLADVRVTIPMPGSAESLNAAVSAGIFLFETVRQRSG